MGYDGPIELDSAKLLPPRPEYFPALWVQSDYCLIDFDLQVLALNPLYAFTPSTYQIIKAYKKAGFRIALYPSQ